MQVLPPHYTPPLPRASDTYALSGLMEQRRADVEHADAVLAACAAECQEVSYSICHGAFTASKAYLTHEWQGR